MVFNHGEPCFRFDTDSWALPNRKQFLNKTGLPADLENLENLEKPWKQNGDLENLENLDFFPQNLEKDTDDLEILHFS